MLKCFTQEIKIIDVLGYFAAGTTTRTSSVIDMGQSANAGGFDAVTFVLSLGTVTSGSVITLTAKQNTANSTSSPTPTTITPNYANVQGSTTAQVASQCSLTVTDAGSSSSKSLALDIILPQERYLFCTVGITTQNCEIRGIVAYLYRLKNIPAALD